MICDVITLPLSIGALATRLGLHVTADLVSVALSATRRLIGAAVPPEPPPAGADSAEGSSNLRFDIEIDVAPRPSLFETPSASPLPRSDVPAGPSQGRVPGASPTTRVAHTAEVPSSAEAPAAVPELAPVHISEEPQFVEAFAEPGAEEGAGASVHVEEPWKGYGRMTASDVVARLSDATPEELAAVALYEGRHRARRTVLAAAQHQLRGATARRP